MSWPRRILVLVPPLAAVALWFQYSPPAPNEIAVAAVDAVVGLVFVVAGLVVWDRRPMARSGPLLVLAGYIWYVGDFTGVGVPALAALSFAWHGYYDVVLAYVALTFPGDRLRGRASRLVIAALLAAFIGRSLVRMFGATAGFGYGPGEPNPFNIIHSHDMVEWLDVHALILISGLMVVVAALVAMRWWRASPAMRRVLGPVAIAAVGGFAVTAFFGLDEYLHHELSLDLIPWNGDAWNIPVYLARTVVPLGFLVSALQLRTARAAVVDLARGGVAPETRAMLRDRLQRALGDPSLRVLVAAPDGAWLDEHGRAVTLPRSGDDVMVTPLEGPDGRVGAIIHDTALLEDPALVRTVANTTRLVLENERLRAELTSQLEEVRASRSRLAGAADAERRRLERDLHDGAQQRLVGLALILRTIRIGLRPEVDATTTRELDTADREVRAALEEVRELARGLHPAILRQAGLQAALVSLAGRSPLEVDVDAHLEGRLPEAVEAAAYFVVAEALTNSAKHAAARSATIRASHEDGSVSVVVTDDGRGGADPAHGTGLRGLFDRVEALGGRLSVTSPAGAGTTIRLEIPCASS